MQKLAVRFWSIVLIAIGMAIFLHKHIQLEIPLTENKQTESWTVQARLSFKSNKRNVKATLHIPNITPGYAKLEEHYISGKYGLSKKTSKDKKTANWAIRQAKGEQTLYYRVTVAPSRAKSEWSSIPDYPVAPKFPEPYATAINKIIDDVRNQSADTATFTHEIIEQLNSSDTSENISLIRSLESTEGGYSSLLIKLLAVAHIPSRQVWTIGLTDAANDVKPIVLIQVFNGDEWLTFDPITGNTDIPKNHLVWSVGDGPLFEIENGNHAELTFSVTKAYIGLINVANKNPKTKKSIFSRLSLNSLPVQSQNTFSLILMVPLGALIVVFMRTFIGIQTFGTFMPILIAIAFRETQLYWGVILFSVIVFIGLLIRFYLEHLRLLLIPRLAAILVVVVILMLIISFTTSQLGLERLLSISLFPMVILAMTIERMSITWEESGAQAALLQGLGSLIVACIGYLVMTNDQLTYLMFAFPELLIVILGLCLWMGRYTGYRLSELIRFKDIKASN